jgi:hypothetical protein
MNTETKTEDETQTEAQKILEEMRKFAAQQNKESLESGAWFQQLIKFALDGYSKNATADYFKAKYSGLPADAVAEALMTTAKRYAALEGGASAAAYSAAIAATIGSVGGASPLTIPAAVAAFALDLSFTTALQLRLAHDLAVIYRVPIDLDDPEDVWELILVAIGIKASELGREVAAKGAPEVVRQGVKAVVKGPVLKLLQRLPLVGKYILQRRVIQFAIPVLGIPLNAGVNWWTTRSIATRAKAVYRDKASILEVASKVVSEDVDALLVIRTIWWIAQADETITDAESRLLRTTMKTVTELHDDGAALEAFERMINEDVAGLLNEIGATSATEKKLIYEAACYAAGIDREFAPKELIALRSLAEVCDVEFDEKGLAGYRLR